MALAASPHDAASLGPAAGEMVAVPTAPFPSRKLQPRAPELPEAASFDGRLLKMFVARQEHTRKGAREAATGRWLIREEFYDRWLEDFARCYAPRKAEPRPLAEPRPEEFGLGGARDQGQLVRVEEASGQKDEKLTLAAPRAPGAVPRKPRPGGLVTELEARLAEGQKDVFTLRDTLLTALEQLSTPRRVRGGCGPRMAEEVKEQLRLREMTRLRELVITCLHGIWDSGVGGDLLLAAVRGVRGMIERYEAREGRSVASAMNGEQWLRLRRLVEEVDDDMPLALQLEDADGAAEARGEKRKHANYGRYGRGSKIMIQEAIGALGGEATTPQICEWIGRHQDFLKGLPNVQLNGQRTKKPGMKPTRSTWERTVQSALHREFEHTGRREGQSYFWRVKAADGQQPPPHADAQPTDDSEDDLPLGALLERGAGREGGGEPGA